MYLIVKMTSERLLLQLRVVMGVMLEMVTLYDTRFQVIVTLLET